MGASCHGGVQPRSTVRTRLCVSRIYGVSISDPFVFFFSDGVTPLLRADKICRSVFRASAIFYGR